MHQKRAGQKTGVVKLLEKTVPLGYRSNRGYKKVASAKPIVVLADKTGSFKTV